MPPPIKVELLPYSLSRAQSADAESRRLLQALEEIVLTVHHIGSMAIPGIYAEPILDLMPVVRSVGEELLLLKLAEVSAQVV